MTPRQRRMHQAAIQKAASAPRKSWLGKYRPLTAVQSAWAKSLLSIWGDCYGGRTSEEAMLDCCGFWSCLQDEEWSDNEAKRITETLKGLRKIGYKGEGLMKMAREILWPHKSISELLVAHMREEDCDFVEKSILSALKKDDPVYVVGVDFYAKRKRVSDIGRFLQEVAPWLTRQQAEDRVRWCISHFTAAVFLTMRDEMKKTLKTDKKS